MAPTPPTPEFIRQVQAKLPFRRQVEALWQSSAERSTKLWTIALGALVIAVIGLNTYGQTRLNSWQGEFYDAINRHDFSAFLHQLVVFLYIVAGLLVLVVAQTWFVELIKINVRRILTLLLLDHWLSAGHAHLLHHAGEVGEHPDQRIHEDVRHLSEIVTDLFAGWVQSSLVLVAFVGVLWTLSSELEIAVFGHAVRIPGYMVWCAIAYSLAGSLVTWLVGRPLIALNAEKYQREAELRFALIKVDEHAAEIASSRGEYDTRMRLGGILESVLETSRKLADRLASLTWITSAYGWGTLVVPALAAAPMYFFGSLTLGGLMMTIGAFGQVQSALRWSVDNFSRLADAKATTGRVHALRDAFLSLPRLDVASSGPA